jgi:hypothetical protein
MDVPAWLRNLGLNDQAFRDNEIDADVLPKLTAEDLKALGVTPIGHRRKLLEAIAELGTVLGVWPQHPAVLGPVSQLARGKTCNSLRKQHSAGGQSSLDKGRLRQPKGQSNGGGTACPDHRQG